MLNSCAVELLAIVANQTKYIPKRQSSGRHFNLKGHKLSDFECTILEKVHDKDPMVLAVREQYWIRKFNAKYKGLNINQC